MPVNNMEELLEQLTLDEKCALVSGADFWSTQDIERLGIPRVHLSDGPSGLRKQAGKSDHLGMHDSLPAACFPSEAALANSWDTQLLRDVGEALGSECRRENVRVLLGPGVNIKRSPLCGRNFEYFSEDPVLAGELAAAYIQGLESTGVAASLKHFALNNQEKRRMGVNVCASMRAMREIYLKPFEIAVKKGKPSTVMCSYNRVNGVYASENHWLLTEVLREEWGFDGLVVSDWGAVNDRVAALRAGMDLDMPGKLAEHTQLIKRAVERGELAGEILDRACERILRCVLAPQPEIMMAREEPGDVARRAAVSSAVLLKNDRAALPLSPAQDVALIGDFAHSPRYQGGGSSHVHPLGVESPLAEMRGIGGNRVKYARGYDQTSDQVHPLLEEEACRAAAECNCAVLVLGLPENQESEGYDRSTLLLPENQTHLLARLRKACDRLIVVLMHGAVVDMSWRTQCDAMLDLYLGGQATGSAMARLLYGLENPSGRLAETVPEKLAHHPSYLSFPDEDGRTYLSEGVFVGYRYFEKADRKPAYPFGFGLSYTAFHLSKLTVHAHQGGWDFRLLVSNVGNRDGSAVVQLYVGKRESRYLRPARELKAFRKAPVPQGQTVSVQLTLDRDELRVWSEAMEGWTLEDGEYQVYVCNSTDETPLETAVHVAGNRTAPDFDFGSALEDVLAVPGAMEIMLPYLRKISFIIPDEEGRPQLLPMMRSLAVRMIYYNGRNEISRSEVQELLDRINRLKRQEEIPHDVSGSDF